ncbi:LamG-like jellyroll fold domain-containing protein [Nonomuraea sp. NPDC059194]|uniref:LamG-like jellyroll fold domain-containing protein n=1 Tax=Nonomuraea sp. NPDC059194 TaxID=3346764 RepID=UPI0036972566
MRTAATEQKAKESMLVVGGQALIDEQVEGDFRDLTAQLQTVSGLKEGTVAVRFRTESKPVAATLLSASDTTAPSTNATLSLNSGVPHFESRQDGRYLALLNGTVSLTDGKDHVLAVSVTSTGTTLYADGAPIATTTGVGLLGQLSGLNGMWLGRNVDNGGPQWIYAGHLDRVAVYGGR